MSKASSLVTLILLLSTPGGAQDHTSEIDKLFAWVTPGMPGCSIAAMYNGKQVVNRVYGLADLERDVPITPNSLFDAASVVKQFIAAATLILVEDGKLSLTEDVRKYVPELPDYGHRITLDHLMTHTSGIRDWTGLGPLTGRQVDALTLTLRQKGLNFLPGEEWAYSNGGYVLLREIVGRASGTSLPEFMRARLFEPLGMKSTVYLADMGTVLKNRALAYERRANGWVMDIQLGNDRGGGGALFSTPGDLLIWNDALTNVRLGKFVTEKLHEPARLANGRTLTYGRGLFLDTSRGDKAIWHSGGSAGYGTFLVRFPAQRLSVASMCNAGELANGGAYARRIFDLFVPSSSTTSPAQTKPEGATASKSGADAADVKPLAGTFFSESDGQPLRLVADGGKLRVAGGPLLDTVAKDRFRNPRGNLNLMSQDEFELHFVSADQIVLESMEGKTTRYRRAQTYKPGAQDLKGFAGRWMNDETRGVFEFAPGQTGLAVRLNDSQPFDFVPVDVDTFQRGGMILRFRRDSAGAVVGLDYSNPVVRNIKFVRTQ